MTNFKELNVFFFFIQKITLPISKIKNRKKKEIVIPETCLNRQTDIKLISNYLKTHKKWKLKNQFISYMKNIKRG